MIQYKLIYNGQVKFIGNSVESVDLNFEGKNYTTPNYEIVTEDTESSEYKLVNYRELRAKAYASLQDQMDMQWHDLQDGTTTWKDHIASVKLQYPKI